MQYTIYTTKERPDLSEQIMDFDDTIWPEFMMHDPVANRHWVQLYTTFPEFQFALCDEGEKLIAAGHSIPFYWDGTLDGLPESWDALVETGFAQKEEGRATNTSSALSITVSPGKQGGGLSTVMLKKMREIAGEQGFGALVAPVRPSHKSRYPLTPFERYVAWTREDGSPFDPWIRAHWRLGAEIVRLAPRSMVIPGTIQEWEQWTSMSFPDSGEYVVPGALVPVTIDREKGEGVYVEPNVWMRHPITPE